MKLKIFPKTFIGSYSLTAGVILIAFLLLYTLMPRFYRAYKEDVLNTDLTSLTASIENKETDEMLRLVERFSRSSDYGVTLSDNHGNVLFSRAMGMGVVLEQGDFTGGNFEMTATVDVIGDSRTVADYEGHQLILELSASVQPIDEASAVIVRVLPYALLICLSLAAAASFIYARTITRPIKTISEAVIDMRSLDKDAVCDVHSTDEIGELAGNIDELYGRLLSAINDLQNEMRNTAAADKEKIDFMLTVSHELKTPLTAVKGMLEGMIHNVGVYKDRDEYLARCGENIDALAALVNEILEASKLELSPSPEDYTVVNIGQLAEAVAGTYRIIALAKQVNISVDIDEDLTVSLPEGLFSKALSNIISNAVKYADDGGMVSVYADSGNLIVDNTCNPLAPEEVNRVFEPFSGGENKGHGLGLYLTERILKVCGLPFEFVPFEKGMRFIVYLP